MLPDHSTIIVLSKQYIQTLTSVKLLGAPAWESMKEGDMFVINANLPWRNWSLKRIVLQNGRGCLVEQDLLERVENLWQSCVEFTM